MAFRFSVVSDVREVLRGNEAMEKGFEDTADSLDDLAREAQRAADKVSNELTGVAKDADTASDKLERKFRDAFREVEKDAKSAGDEIGDKVKKGAREAEDGVDRLGDTTAEFKDEARSNFSEIASSFSGDMDSAVDLVQGTLGGLAGSLTGPIGLAFGGLGAAAGLFYNAWSENAEKTEQRISDMYEDMLASGNDYLSREYIEGEISKITQGAEDAVRSFDQVKKDADVLGISVSTVLRAWSGDQAAVNEVLDTAKSRQAELLEQFRSGDLAGADYTKLSTALTGVTNGLSDTNSEAGKAREGINAYREAIDDIPDEMNTTATADTDQATADLDVFRRNVSSSVSIPVEVDTTDADRTLLRWQTQARSVRIATTLGERVV